MKEATGEVSMTIGTWLFAGDNAQAKKWIENTFEEKTGAK